MSTRFSSLFNDDGGNGPGEAYSAIGGVLLTACRVATAAALPACTPAGTGVGHTLTGNAVGILTVDGVNLVLNDRLVVKDQVGADDNGIYKVTTAGTAGVAFVITRATDFDALSASEIALGARVSVTAGTVNAGTTWVLTTAPATLDTNNLAFTQGVGGDATLYTDAVTLWAPHDPGKNVYIDLSVTETYSLTGSFTIQVATGSVDEKDADTLPWRTYTAISVSTSSPFTVSAGVISVSGTGADFVELKNMCAGWLRVKWTGILGEGTARVRITTKA